MIADEQQAEQPVRLAVFDFDGTCLEGNSPELLVWWLFKLKMMTYATAGKLVSWGLRYKFHLRQDESSARGLVFRSFQDMPKEEADAFLLDFYEKRIAGRIRQQAVEEVAKRNAEGYVTVMLSATFETIAIRAMQDIPFQYQISTRMVVGPDGHYTTKVDGLPIEGEEKVCALTRWADAKYGKGNWVAEVAYGDHHSDRPILDFAKEAYSVTPDGTLKRYSKVQGWPVLDWAQRLSSSASPTSDTA